MNIRAVEKEIHELNMCLCCDDNLGLITKNKMEERVKYLENLLKQRKK